MPIEDIIEYVLATYDGLVVDRNWGERGLFYNPNRAFPKGVYLLTFKERDGTNDAASNVNRPGVFRLNLGISKQTFRGMFGVLPSRPPAGQPIAGPWDFQALDTITPHPVYGWMAWIAVLNPGVKTFETLKPLIDEGYALAVQRFRRRKK